jgi:hypothetical protein
MKIVLITSCSGRKSVPQCDRVSTELLSQGSLKQISGEWRSLLKSHKYKLEAGKYYVGRGIVEAKKAANIHKSKHWIISAGLGLISINQQVPAYDLTIRGKVNSNVCQNIKGERFNLQKWWTEINKHHNSKFPLADLIKTHPKSIYIIAIPSTYFDMISQDLGTLNSKQLSRIRIMGPAVTNINNKFHPFYLPYDYRLDGPDSPIRGTRSDYPQRAAHHFLKYIYPKSKLANASKHAKLVTSQMNKMKYLSIPDRVKKSDIEIINLILEHWEENNGSSARLLRTFRDTLLVACEQGRFRNLFYKAKEIRGPKI